MPSHITNHGILPLWVRKGTLVRYYSGTKYERGVRTIESEPWLIGNTWCVKVSGKPAAVSVGFLKPAKI